MSASEKYTGNTAEQFISAQQGDRAALDQLVRHNIPLVKYIVKRFLNRGKEYDDLFQTGCIGLIKAIQKFDSSYEAAFSTYAVPLIMGEIRRLLRDDNSVHISRSLNDAFAKISSFRQSFVFEHGREATVNDIRDSLHLPEDTIVMALNLSNPVHSFSEPIAPDAELTIGDMLSMDSFDSIEERLTIHSMLSRLPENDRNLILSRYFQCMTQREIGEATGKTQVQVSRMESRIIKQLKSMYRTTISQ